MLKRDILVVSNGCGSVLLEQCPDRLDLIDKHFRKFCTVVVDLDEWGQIACINLLTRYARTQFTDPNFGVWYLH